MKILCLGDLHLNDKQPANRIDDYWETCKRKLNFIFDTAKKEGAEIIVSPGDLTDTPALPYQAFSELVELLNDLFEIAFGVWRVFI